jgi:Fe-S cluster assembly protein SufB
MSSDNQLLEGIGDYKYGFSDPDVSVYNTGKGLSRDVVEQISAMKGEPQWMLDFRLRALAHYEQRPMPTWGGDIAKLDLENIYYYVRPSDGEGKSWDDIPDSIKDTFDKLGIH